MVRTSFYSMSLGFFAVALLAGCNAPGKNAKLSPEKPPAASAPEKNVSRISLSDEELYKRSCDDNNRQGLECLSDGDLADAERLFLVALRQVENYPGEYAREAMILNNLASVYEKKEMYSQALPLLNRSQKLFIRAYGLKSPMVSLSLSNLARVLSKQYRYQEAMSVYQTAVELMEANPQADAEVYRESLEGYIVALEKTGRGDTAQKIRTRLEEFDAGKKPKKAASTS